LINAGKIILEATILTTAVVVGLTLYTFWAAKRGYDFNFLGPFLFSAVIVLLVFGVIQVNLKLMQLFCDLPCNSNDFVYQTLLVRVTKQHPYFLP
jgi:FtsH-binding integral membrane protein